MAMDFGKYSQYFDVDEKYFPCFDDSAISAGAAWDDTYPHDAFIKLLENAERMLSGSMRRSIWIHGAYGTGKSKCAYALKKILEVPEDELKAYWGRYDNLENKQDLLNKLLGHKSRGIVTAYRYSSGSITTPSSLFFAIQESVSRALHESDRVSYYGENTLKQSVVAWLEDEANKSYFDALLKRPKWSSLFSQSDADGVLKALSRDDASGLMENIARLAEEQGITAMTLDADLLKEWLKDVISKNNIRIVFVWDEFSSFFKVNRNSLDEFQKIVALCQEAPFYLTIVTHQTESIINNDDQSWSIVKQRFELVGITLPDNLAFELIDHAFSPKQAALSQWNQLSAELNGRLNDSRKRVMAAAKVDESSRVIEGMLPIHPMAALVLKNIASAFQSNQRSMFDFIKTQGDSDVKAFQWFIENTGPYDEFPLLTIDLLWDFFYEKGRDNLTQDIRTILDTYPQQQNLNDEQKRVLKTVLIMEAIDKRLGGMLDLIKPTDQNLSYAFEGTPLEGGAKTIAKRMTELGILVNKPIGNNKTAYGVAVLAGDQGKIDELKKKIKGATTTEKLVVEGGLSTVLGMHPATALRTEKTAGSGELQVVTRTNFTKVMNSLKPEQPTWRLKVVLAIAKDDAEAASMKKLIKQTVESGEHKDLVIVDALQSPLGQDDLDQYFDYSAMAQYYQGNNNRSSVDNERKAKQVLTISWKNRIKDGAFYVYYEDQPDGERVFGAAAVNSLLQAIIQQRHPYLYDYAKGLSEALFKTSTAKQTAKCGIVGKGSGVANGLENKLFQRIWTVPNYWNNPDFEGEGIVLAKRSVLRLIEKSFEQEGQISIGEICSHLEEAFGYAPSSLTSFITGYLLRDYAEDKYRFTDASSGQGPMSPEKLSEIIGNCIHKKDADPCIVMMTADEKAFYEVTEKAWGIPEGTCSSIVSASTAVRGKMRELKLPVWALREVDEWGAYETIEKYIQFIQLEGRDAQKIAVEVGGLYQRNPDVLVALQNLITPEKCQIGMMDYLDRFDGGELKQLANRIGASESLLQDVSTLFEVRYANLWKQDIGDDLLRQLAVDYKLVEGINIVLSERFSSKESALEGLADKLKFLLCSCDLLRVRYPNASLAFEYLKKVYANEELTPERTRDFASALQAASSTILEYFSQEESVFLEVYEDYVAGLDEQDVSKLSPCLSGMFGRTKTDSNNQVKSVVETYKKGLAKTQLADMWRERTGSKNPRDWSDKHRTPILLLVENEDYDRAKDAFETISRGNSTEQEISRALDYIKDAGALFDGLNDSAKVDAAFVRMLGKKALLLKNISEVRDDLERLPIPAYEWASHPTVQERLNKLARAEYNAGGSDQAVKAIEALSLDELKAHLTKLAREDMDLGLAIIGGEG